MEESMSLDIPCHFLQRMCLKRNVNFFLFVDKIFMPGRLYMQGDGKYDLTFNKIN